MINKAVIVSGEQQRDSAIHIHVPILPQTPLPSRLSRNTEQSSMCCIVGPCWLSFFFFSKKFIYFNWRLITLQYCIGFAIHQLESATGEKQWLDATK